MNRTDRFRILAVEPDLARGENLRRLIKQRVDADVMIATSSQAAITSLSRQVPDLVLTSALLSPADDQQLIAHLKQIGETQDLPILSVPPVVADQSTPVKNRRRLGFLKQRTAPSLFPAYDPDVVGDRIAEALRASVNSRSRRLKDPLPFVHRNAPEASALLTENCTSLVLPRAGHPRRDRAERWAPGDLPWLGGVRTPWGLSLELLNISTSGLLVESPTKFMPDTFSELHLVGPGTSIIVPARLVRSEVSEVTSRGVKYRTAAVFNRTLDLVLEEHGVPGALRATPRALADLVNRLTGDQSRQPRDARRLFEQGLRQLVPAREIQLRATPSPSGDGGESVYFTVPTGKNSPPILQVTFEPDYEPGEAEMALLKAAAAVAAVVLECEGASPMVGSVNAW